MKLLTVEELLSSWEQGLSQPLLQRALILLAAAFPDVEPDALVEMPIGQRDLRLLQLREYLFGQQLLNSAVCPGCDERVEWQNRVADFLIDTEQSTATVSQFDLATDDYSLRFRLPNSIDIAMIAASESIELARRRLLSRCLLEAKHSGTVCDIGDLPAATIEKLEQRIEALDPQADIQVSLVCPACSHRWDLVFDIAGYLWKEVNDWAIRMLQTVHKLAAAYGWSEREVLNLSSVRRQLYLGMLT